MPQHIEIGDWIVNCCCADAYQLKTKEDIEDAIDTVKNAEDYGVVRIYKTKEEVIDKECSCGKNSRGQKKCFLSDYV